MKQYTEHKKQWYQQNKKRVIKKSRENYKENRECRLEYRKQYYQRTKERQKRYFRGQYKKNRIKVLEKQKIVYQERKAIILVKNGVWRQKNLEHVKEYRKNHQYQHKKYMKEYNQNNPRSSTRYSLELQETMNNVRKRDHNTCQWQNCGLTHREAPIHVNHIFPRSEYPELELVEEYMICYCKKHHKMFHEYRGDEFFELIK